MILSAMKHICYRYCDPLFSISIACCRFCKRYGLSLERINELKELQHDLLRNLAALGYLSSSQEALSMCHCSNRNESKPLVVMAMITAGLFPSIAKVIRPPQRYVKLYGGNMEKATEAKDIRFFIPNLNYNPSDSSNGMPALTALCATSDYLKSVKCLENSSIRALKQHPDISTLGLSQVFIHPMSVNFKNNTYSLSNFVVFSDCQTTTKTYLREISEVSPFALLFFGGTIDADYTNQIISVDNWIRFEIIQIIRIIVVIANNSNSSSNTYYR